MIMYMVSVNMGCNNYLKSRSNTFCQFLSDLVSKLRSNFLIRRKTLNIVVCQYFIILAKSKSYNIELCNKTVDTVITAIQKA